MRATLFHFVEMENRFVVLFLLSNEISFFFVVVSRPRG